MKRIKKIIGLLAGVVTIIVGIYSILFTNNSDSDNIIYKNQSPEVETNENVNIEFHNYNYNKLKNNKLKAGDNIIDKKEIGEVFYFVENSKNSFYSSLIANVDGKEYVLIDFKDEYCLDIVAQKDFDNNNTPDVLITDITACGGNCCPNSFFFYTYLGDGHFIRSKEFGYSWKEPIIKSWKGRWRVNIVSNNEGINYDEPQEKRASYILDGWMVIKLYESNKKSIRALVEVESNYYSQTENDEKKKLLFDINRDGIKDTLTTSPWRRWGRMFWEIRFSGGLIYEGGIAAKRLGILPSITNGYHDIVVDQDLILKWNGTNYSQQMKK